MLVIAPKGKTCPRQGCRDLIDDITPREVPDTLYYRRRLAYGDLIPATVKKPAINHSTKEKGKA